jgi:FMN phosphatase YigB (HAD superfamily)
MKLIIFDLDDTIFDTTGQLNGSYENLNLIKIFPGTIKLLKTLKNKKITLILISTGNKVIQKKKIKLLKIEHFFDDMLFCKQPNKKIDLFKKILKKYPIRNKRNIFVIGDRIDREIMFGNILGCTTVRLFRGKWKKLKPENLYQIPMFTIKSIKEFTNFL